MKNETQYKQVNGNRANALLGNVAVFYQSYQSKSAASVVSVVFKVV